MRLVCSDTIQLECFSMIKLAYVYFGAGVKSTKIWLATRRASF